MKKKFGELLLERGLITPEQLADALALQRRRGMRLGAALVARGHMTETQLVQALGSVLHIAVVDLTKLTPSLEAVRTINARFAEDNDLIPYAVRKERGRRVLSIAMADPLNYRALDELSFMTDSLVEPALARASDIEKAVTKYYAQEHRPSAYGKDAFGADLLALASAEGEKTTMTILRKGGAEETIDVVTGKVVSPFIKGADGGLLENPAVTLPDGVPAMKPPAMRKDEISAVLLTEEVADSTPESPVLKTPAAGTKMAAAIPPAVTTNPRAPLRPQTGSPPTAPATSPVPTSGRQPVMTAPASSVGFAHGLATPPPAGAYAPTVTPAPTLTLAPPGPAPAPAASPLPTENPYFDDALGALIDAAGGAVNADQFYRLERKFWALMRLLAKKGLITSEEFMEELGEEDSET